MCEHLEIGEFGAYNIPRSGGVETAVLLKCASCGKLLTLDSEEIPEEGLEKAMLSRESMRTLTVQVNRDIYDRIQNLARQEGIKEEDPSKIANELFALGLHHYGRTLSRHRPEKNDDSLVRKRADTR